MIHDSKKSEKIIWRWISWYWYRQKPLARSIKGQAIALIVFILTFLLRNYISSRNIWCSHLYSTAVVTLFIRGLKKKWPESLFFCDSFLLEQFTFFIKSILGIIHKLRWQNFGNFDKHWLTNNDPSLHGDERWHLMTLLTVNVIYGCPCLR